MGVLVGKKAPNFRSTAVFKDTFKEISLEDYLGKYVILHKFLSRVEDI
jgi:alkyl hydroperoxide reductase subunit AhpC